jgi:hypothetical protein
VRLSQLVVLIERRVRDDVKMNWSISQSCVLPVHRINATIKSEIFETMTRNRIKYVLAPVRKVNGEELYVGAAVEGKGPK